MRSSCRVLTLLILATSFLFSITLKTTFQLAPPKYMEENGKPAGIGYEVFRSLQNVLKGQGVNLVWDGNFRNMREIQKMLSSCSMDFFIGMARTKQRMSEYRFSSYPVYSLGYTMLTRKGEKRPTKVAVVSGTKTEKLLGKVVLEKSVRVLQVKNVEEALEYLRSGKVDSVFYNSMSLGYFYTRNRNAYSIGQGSGKYYQFIVFSKCVPRGIIQMVDKALMKVLKAGLVERAIARYGIWDYVKPGNYLTFASIDQPPYEFTSNGKWFGIDAEVVQKIFKDMGFEVFIDKMSWMRTLKSLELGVLDGTFSISATEERRKYLYFSPAPLSVGIDGFLYRKDRLKPSNLYVPMGFTCGYVPGHVYSEVLNSETLLHLIPMPNDEIGVRAVVAGRLDLYAVNKFVGMYYLRELNALNEVGFFPAFGKRYYYLALSKVDSWHKEILEDFSKRFEKFKLTKEYRQILDKYHINYEDIWKM